MKFFLQLSLFTSTALATAESASAKFIPARISFDDLASGIESGIERDDDVFWKSLRQVGLLSVTDIPGFNKESMLQDLEDCLHRQRGVGAPDFDLDHLTTSDHRTGSNSDDENKSFRRRTLATRTLSGNPEGILVATKSQRDNNIDNSRICGDLEASSQVFRNAVQSVSEAVAARFGSMESLALATDGGGGKNQRIPIETLINEGEHLEHFHSYYSKDDGPSTTSDTLLETTIDWHTDQGMMLLFTPGQFRDGTPSNGFFIRLADGSTAEVAFDSKIDDLVIMLGDGVNQYINGGKDAPALRAVPHAVRLPNESNTPRLWYGRMVLPPPTAIHPLSGQGSTFRDVRTAMIRGEKDALSLGCATSNVSARELMEDHFSGENQDEMACDTEIALLCWMTCMSYEENNVSVEDCASQSDDHEVVCANEDGGLWDMEKHKHNPAYSLRCLSSEEIQQSETGMGGMDGHMEHDHSDMEHDHSDMKMDSGACGSDFFGLATGLLGITMMVAMMM